MPVISFNGTEIPVRERAGSSGVEYTFPLAIPATAEQVTVIARIGIRSDGMRAVVHVKDAPDCRRHRFSDQSLCMWFDPDAPEHKWTMADGLDQLAAHVARHLFQEAVCRAGDSWPGEESPGVTGVAEVDVGRDPAGPGVGPQLLARSGSVATSVGVSLGRRRSIRTAPSQAERAVLARIQASEVDEIGHDDVGLKASGEREGAPPALGADRGHDPAMALSE